MRFSGSLTVVLVRGTGESSGGAHFLMGAAAVKTGSLR